MFLSIDKDCYTSEDVLVLAEKLQLIPVEDELHSFSKKNKNK